MDWPMKNTTWSSHDLSNYDYDERQTCVMKMNDGDETIHSRWLKTQNDWDAWFEKAPGTSATLGIPQPKLLVMLCSKAPAVFEGQPSPISYLPFAKEVWQRLTEEFHVHREITPFTARMSAYLPDDLALSITYMPRTGTIYAVIYGCSWHQMQEIESRVRSAKDQAHHPLLMMGIFAELERKRLVGLVDKLLDNFTLRAEHVENGVWNPATEMDSMKAQGNLRACFQSQNLVDHIRAVKRQLSKFLTEIDNVADIMFSECSAEQCSENIDFQIKQRIRDIMIEYDDKIDECNMVIGNTSLAMQTVWNHIARHDSKVNTQIARANTGLAAATKREGTQMKSIALLTMTYLPLSTVASIFSTSLFNWGAHDGETVVSKYIWIFVVISLFFTGLTLLAWRFHTSRMEALETKKHENGLVQFS